MIRRLVLVFLALVAAAALALAGMIALSAPGTPPPIGRMQTEAAELVNHLGDLPGYAQFEARDGGLIAYRTYPAALDRVAVLVHGSAASSFLMHMLARDLQREGITAYSLDVRGHGQSGRKGDIDYVGQLDHDLVDFLAHIERRHPGARRALVGFSSGGGFALRIAGGPEGERFDAYVLLAPFLAADAPTIPQGGRAEWVSAAVPRIVGLAVLGRLGLSWWSGLPVLGFAMTPEQQKNPALTPFYSFRLWANFSPRRDWQGGIRAVRRPTAVFVGEQDELMRADQFAPTFAAVRSDIPVRVVPKVGHVGLIANDAANAEIVATVAKLLKP